MARITLGCLPLDLQKSRGKNWRRTRFPLLGAAHPLFPPVNCGCGCPESVLEDVWVPNPFLKKDMKKGCPQVFVGLEGEYAVDNDEVTHGHII